LVKHLDEAKRAQANCKVIHLPRIALDIDDPEDVAMLMEQGGGSPTYELLAQMRINERLKAMAR
jgi:2-phospho-L-lactate guanylyltransferase (CobY/MobA/RfbA family)